VDQSIPIGDATYFFPEESGDDASEGALAGTGEGLGEGDGRSVGGSHFVLSLVICYKRITAETCQGKPRREVYSSTILVLENPNPAPGREQDLLRSTKVSPENELKSDVFTIKPKHVLRSFLHLFQGHSLSGEKQRAALNRTGIGIHPGGGANPEL
jgi:hypothetical protein